MIDRNGNELKVGDYIIYHSTISYPGDLQKYLCKVIRVGQDGFVPYQVRFATVEYLVDGRSERCDVTHSESLELISVDEAMIFMLEG